MEWHHIVEQNQLINNVAEKIPPGRVYNKANTIALDRATHRKLSALYSSLSENDTTKSVREWLRGKSFDEQYKFGIERLRDLGVDI
jgi:hypothetical protein